MNFLVFIVKLRDIYVMINDKTIQKYFQDLEKNICALLMLSFLLLFFKGTFIFILFFIFFIILLIYLKKNKRFAVKGVMDLEIHLFSQAGFLEKLVSNGEELISQMEQDALLDRIRHSFHDFTKAPAGYLLLYNQNKNIFEWGIGHNISILKMKTDLVPASDPLMIKIMSQTSSIVFLDVHDLLSPKNIIHCKEEALLKISPDPEVLVAIKMKMKDSILGILFLFLTRIQTKEVQNNWVIFNAFVNQGTLALGSAVQRDFAINDRMTLVYNHDYFISRLKDELALCQRRKERNLTLLLLDIDHFKKFNDTYGHQIGDFVLIECARLFQECIRISDMVARYGGEEFVVILPETSLTEGLLVAEKIRSSVENHIFKTSKGTLKVTISVGVAEWKQDLDPPMNAESMIKLSDEKLYESKQKGRNRVSC